VNEICICRPGENEPITFATYVKDGDAGTPLRKQPWVEVRDLVDDIPLSASYYLYLIDGRKPIRGFTGATVQKQTSHSTFFLVTEVFDFD
jgi:hypothetical protein